ncbi:MAG: hypothetical protein ACI9NT_001930, partial [Bacteroidia bacterium]
MMVITAVAQSRAFYLSGVNDNRPAPVRSWLSLKT